MGHGDDRRAGQKAFVVVPHIGAITLAGIDHRDLLETFAQVGVESVDFRLAEVASKGQVLLGAQRGNRQDQGFVSDQRRLECRQRFWQHHRGGIEIEDFGTQVWTKGPDSERGRHGQSPDRAEYPIL